MPPTLPKLTLPNLIHFPIKITSYSPRVITKSRSNTITKSSMARITIFKHHSVSTSYIGLGVGSFILCAFALFMCAGHARRRTWRKWKSCYGSVHYTHDPVISLNPQEMPGYQFGDPDPSTYSCDQGSVWKKNILMGGKCQLPDFSGVIIYDSKGSLVPPPTPRQALPALTWK